MYGALGKIPRYADMQLVARSFRPVGVCVACDMICTSQVLHNLTGSPSPRLQCCISISYLHLHRIHGHWIPGRWSLVTTGFITASRHLQCGTTTVLCTCSGLSSSSIWRHDDVGCGRMPKLACAGRRFQSSPKRNEKSRT